MVGMTRFTGIPITGMTGDGAAPTVMVGIHRITRGITVITDALTHIFMMIIITGTLITVMTIIAGMAVADQLIQRYSHGNCVITKWGLSVYVEVLLPAAVAQR